MIVLAYCILSLFNCMICLCCSLALRDIFHDAMARYVPLNTKQTNKDTQSIGWQHFQ